MFFAIAGLALAAFSQYSQAQGKANEINASNTAKLQQYNTNAVITAEMISTLDERTNRAQSEAVRTAIRTKMNINKASYKAEGDAAVKAAQLGSGSGVRAELNIFKPSSRIAGDLITDAEIDLQTELTNITEHFNDTANKALANLKNHVPALGAPPGTADMLMAGVGGAMNYYNNMSATQKADIGSLFKTSTVENYNSYNRIIPPERAAYLSDGGGGFGR